MLGFMFFIFLAIGVIFLIKIKVTNKGIALIEKALTSILSAFIFSALIVHSIGMPIEVAFIFFFLMFLVILFFEFFIGNIIIIIVVIPALLFYHISLLFKAILKKEVTLIKD